MNTEDMSYDELKAKASELGLKKVTGVSKGDLAKYIEGNITLKVAPSFDIAPNTKYEYRYDPVEDQIVEGYYHRSGEPTSNGIKFRIERVESRFINDMGNIVEDNYYKGSVLDYGWHKVASAEDKECRDGLATPGREINKIGQHFDQRFETPELVHKACKEWLLHKMQINAHRIN